MPLFMPNISKLEEQKNVAKLCKLLQDKDSVTRMQAANALGNIKDARAVRPLIEFAVGENRKRDELTAALNALGSIGDPGAAETLHVFTSSDWQDEVNLEAAVALWRVGDVHALDDMISMLSRNIEGDLKSKIIQSIGWTGVALAIDTLVSLLNDPSLCRDAIRALRHIGDPVIIPPLLSLRQHPDAYVRIELVRALADFPNDERAACYLLASLRDPDGYVRSNAAAAIADSAPSKLGLEDQVYCHIANEDWKWLVEHGTESVSALTSMLDVTDEGWKPEIIRTLGEIGDPCAADLILKMLVKDLHPALDRCSPAFHTKIAAIIALGRLKSPQVVEPLCGLLQHPLKEIQENAAVALGQIADPAAVDRLAQALWSINRDVRVSARYALSLIPDPRAEAERIKYVRYDESMAGSSLKCSACGNPVSKYSTRGDACPFCHVTWDIG